MTIFQKSDTIFEYKIDNDTYTFTKDESDDTNEDGDRIRGYSVVLKLTSSSDSPRFFVKKFIDKQQERDNVFSALEEKKIDDFSGWDRQ